MLSWLISKENLGEVSLLPFKCILSPGASGDSGEAVSHTEGSGLHTCSWLGGGVMVEMGKELSVKVDAGERSLPPASLSFLYPRWEMSLLCLALHPGSCL